MDAALDIFSTENFMPHGHCYLWLPHILWTHVISDGLIGVAYFTIPAALLYFARKRPDLGLNNVIHLFIAFILMCGLTHFMSIYTIWNPAYFPHGILKALTAIVSVATAIALWPLLPKLIATPTLSQLEEANTNLLNEVQERKKSEAALTNKNRELRRLNETLEEAVRALRVSEERLELAVEGGDVGLWDWDIETNEDWFSEKWLEFLGYAPGEVDYHFDTWQKNLHPEDRDMVFKVLDNHLQKEAPYNPEFRMRTKGGDYIWVEAFGKARRRKTGSPYRMSGTLRDITERKKIEIELENTRVFQQTLLENVQDGVVACDEEGQLTLFNKAARNFHGIDVDDNTKSPDEWAERYDLYEADGETPLVKERIPLFQAFQSNVVEKQEMVIAPKGLPRRNLIARASPLFSMSGDKIGAVATMHDVTAHRTQAEEELRIRKNELEVIFNNVPVRIFYKDDKNRIIRLNETAAQSMGMSVADAEGADTYDLFPDMAKKYHDDDLEIINSGEPKLGIVEEYTPKGQDKSWIRTNKVPYTDLETGKRYVFAAAMDITELKIAQEELHRSNTALEQFARVASHDLQEPLRKLIIFSEFLKEDLGSDIPEKAQTDVDAIVSSAERMRNLVREILALSRVQISSQPLKAIQPRECIDHALKRIVDEDKGEIAEFTFDDFPDVMAESVLLTQIYQNLITNALKFMPGDRHPKIHFTSRLEDEYVTLGVQDNGIGISSDYFDKIFQPLERLHSHTVFEGTGIGLAICKRAVEQLGGKIWVESTLDSGSHFQFTLRLAAA